MGWNIVLSDEGTVLINGIEYVPASLPPTTDPEDFENLEKLFTIVKSFEGFYANAYKCPADVWTIGWGTIKYANGKSVKEGDVITRENAEKELRYELQEKINFVKKNIPHLNNDQFQAIVSFAYNCGTGALQGTQIRKALDERRYNDVPSQLMRWVHASGKVQRGLVRRRMSESLLFKGYDPYIVPLENLPSTWENMKYYDDSFRQYAYVSPKNKAA